MDSRDIIIIGAVAVAAYLYWKNAGSGGTIQVALPTAAAGPGTTNMTQSAAATTSSPFRGLPPRTNQVAPASVATFSGFSAVNMNPIRFSGSTALAVVADNLSPAPVTRPPIVASPTIVGGAGVFSSGAGAMGPQPPRTTILNPTRY